MWNWQKVKEPAPGIQFRGPSLGKDKSYWPQIGGVVVDKNYEELNDLELNKKQFPDPPIAVLRNGVHILQKTDGWQQRVIQAIWAGEVIQGERDEEVEAFIIVQSAKRLMELASRARNTVPA